MYKHLVDSGQVDLNRMTIEYQKGKFTKDEFMEFYRGCGCSVCYFAEVFEGAEIENPVWNKGDK